MNYASRSLLYGLTLVSVLVALAVAGVLWQGRRAAPSRLLHRLQHAGMVETELTASRLQELQSRAETLADDSAFVDYVAQSLIPNQQRGGSVDSASIGDLLTERRHGYDIAAVLDARGTLVATSGLLLRSPASIRRDRLVTRAINTLKPVQGAWVDQGQLLWVAVNPLLRGVVLQGVLLTASHVDARFANTVGRIADTEVAFVLPPSPGAARAPASAMAGWAAQALSAQSAAVLALSSPQAWNLVDAGHTTTTWVMPLDATGGRAALVAVDPHADAGAAPDGDTQPLLLRIVLLGIGGVVIVLWHWRRTWLPLQKMAQLIDGAGKRHRPAVLQIDGSPIVRRLRDGINRLPRPDPPPIPVVSFHDPVE
jgi:hypothetical protein